MKRALRRAFVFTLLFAAWSGLARPSDSPAAAKECVVLLHGLGRSHRSMENLAGRLSGQGYDVLNLNYPSRRHSIEYLADHVLAPAVERIKEAAPDKIHFVTHSMGGIIVRHYLRNHALDRLGRVVMVSPPNQGSELADLIKKILVFKSLMTPAGRELGTDEKSLPRTLGPAEFELGIIAGNKSHNFIQSWIIAGPDDGTVSVESTKIEGMTDFIVLPRSHSSIIKSQEACAQVLHFLKHGAFLREADI